MATKKQPPAKTTKRKSAPKVFDVARPGQSAASSTSKPVMITNRPVIQDPMVNEVKRDDLVAPPTLPPRKVVIKPVHDDVTPDAVVPVSVTVTDDSMDTAEPVVVVTKQTPETPKEPETIAFSETVSGVPTQNPTAPDNQLRTNTEVVKESGKLNPNMMLDPMITPGVPNSKDDKQLPPDQAAADLLAAQTRAAELQHIIDKQQYFLPIKTTEERRSRRVAVFGLLLIIILGLAWYDVALDAGLVNNTYNLPHSHFFTLK